MATGCGFALGARALRRAGDARDPDDHNGAPWPDRSSTSRRTFARRSRSTSTACARSAASTTRSRDGALVFERELKKEGKLGFWRWFLGAWGVGTYRQNDSVDVSYERNGRPVLLEGLDIEPRQ